MGRRLDALRVGKDGGAAPGILPSLAPKTSPTATRGSRRTEGTEGTEGTRVDKWTITVTKLDAPRRRVFGYALISKTTDNRPVIDLQGDYVEPEDMEEAAYDFVKNARVGGEMHQGAAPATLIESMAFTPEKMAALGIPAGILPTAHYVGFEVPPETFDRVRAGQRLMFSVEGTGDRQPMGEDE